MLFVVFFLGVLSASRVLRILLETPQSISAELPPVLWPILNEKYYTLSNPRAQNSLKFLLEEYEHGTNGQVSVIRLIREMNNAYSHKKLPESIAKVWFHSLRLGIWARFYLFRAKTRIKALRPDFTTGDALKLLESQRAGYPTFEEFVVSAHQLTDDDMHALIEEFDRKNGLEFHLNIKRLERILQVELLPSLAEELKIERFSLMDFNDHYRNQTILLNSLWEEWNNGPQALMDRYVSRSFQADLGISTAQVCGTKHLVDVLHSHHRHGLISDAEFSAFFNNEELLLYDRAVLFMQAEIIRSLEENMPYRRMLNILDSERNSNETLLVFTRGLAGKVLGKEYWAGSLARFDAKISALPPAASVDEEFVNAKG